MYALALLREWQALKQATKVAGTTMDGVSHVTCLKWCGALPAR